MPRYTCVLCHKSRDPDLTPYHYVTTGIGQWDYVCDKCVWDKALVAPCDKCRYLFMVNLLDHTSRCPNCSSKASVIATKGQDEPVPAKKKRGRPPKNRG